MLPTSGCYLGHLALGQARLLGARRPVDDVIGDPHTPAPLRAQLRVVEEARAFAAGLGLDVVGQYTSYVAWPGDRVMTTVVATRPGEVDPAGFWFPFLGRLPYKGFFDPGRAEELAAELRADGLDVCVVPVPAYSTLGWLDDPVTQPMLRRGEGETVETIFHELVHATVYVKEHIDFNETVASFIGQEASVRFYEQSAAPQKARARRIAVDDRRRITEVLLDLRQRVAALYASSEPGPGRDAARAALEHEARERLSDLDLRDPRAAEIARAVRLNDACLALSGTYGAHLDRYVARLDALGGDLPAFVVELRSAAAADDPEAALLGP